MWSVEHCHKRSWNTEACRKSTKSRPLKIQFRENFQSLHTWVTNIQWNWVTCWRRGPFLGPIMGEKDGENVINLNDLSQFIPYQHFKTEGMFCLRELFQKGDCLFKLNMKDAYFSVPLHQSSRKYLRFLWARNEFLCLCFGLGPSPRIFTKLLNVPMSMLRRINIRIIIHLGDMLLMGATVEEISMSRDTLVFFLQLWNSFWVWKCPFWALLKKIEFLGLNVDSIDVTVSLKKKFWKFRHTAEIF